LHDDPIEVIRVQRSQRPGYFPVQAPAFPCGKLPVDVLLEKDVAKLIQGEIAAASFYFTLFSYQPALFA
jgi:hypothetical protein